MFMNIGFIGLGKLGLPCAVAIAMHGHNVMGYDIVSSKMNKNPRPFREAGPDGKKPFNFYLKNSRLRFGSLKEVVDHAEIIFVAVQTPHHPQYEGVTRLPEQRDDFDYKYLVAAIAEISFVVRKETIVVIISTVLPSTIREYVMPMASSLLRLCYNPFFIAMGTTMRDFLEPEFILLGVCDEQAAKTLVAFYRTITDAPICQMSLESAELTKVAYNTYIGMKIVFANMLMEICHKLPNANVNDVIGALKKSHRRLISTAYMDGGMGDGGGCHPRDNIAMSWLARKLSLSYNLFEDIMRAREHQTAWLADLMCAYDLPKAIIGYSFKAESNLTDGSPSLLLKTILEERGYHPYMYDPHVEGKLQSLSELPPHVFLIGTRHKEFMHCQFPSGSVVIDPWRYIPPQPTNIILISLGGKDYANGYLKSCNS